MSSINIEHVEATTEAQEEVKSEPNVLTILPGPMRALLEQLCVEAVIGYLQTTGASNPRAQENIELLKKKIAGRAS